MDFIYPVMDFKI